jgi:O-antigen ligase
VARPAKKLASRFNGEAVPFWALTAFLVLTFVLGGGSRSDIQSLIILRPASIIFCGLGLWSLRWGHIRDNQFLFGMAAAIFALVLIHLLPLPPLIWRALPGREIIVAIDKAAELDAVWRPISMVPSGTWNALFSLFAPLAVLILGAQVTRDQRYALLYVLLAIGLTSGFLGILQVISAPDGPLYPYSITNNGSAVGLFSNRNHQAMFLASLFPMLAIAASTMLRSEEQSRIRMWMAISVGILLVPLLLVVGSRAGLILGVLGLLASLLLYRKPTALTPKKRTLKKFDLRYVLVIFAVICVGAVTIAMSRAEAFQRLFAGGQAEDDRLQMWLPAVDMAWKYFPVGSGVGSFVNVFQIDEPYKLLIEPYANHAHNDWLELYLTAGLPALLLLGVAIAGYAKRCWLVFRSPPGDARQPRFARLGAVVIALLALGSVGDYPLRTPSLACAFVVAALWLTSREENRTKFTGSA